MVSRMMVGDLELNLVNHESQEFHHLFGDHSQFQSEVAISGLPDERNFFIHHLCDYGKTTRFLKLIASVYNSSASSRVVPNFLYPPIAFTV